MDRSITDFNSRLKTIRIRDLIVGIIVTSILLIILMITTGDFLESGETFAIVLLIIASILFIFAFWGSKGIGNSFSELLDRDTQKIILIVLVLNMFFAMLLPCLISNLEVFLSMMDPAFLAAETIEDVTTSDPLMFDIATSIIFAPILEELVFRGILFNRTKLRIGIIPAMVLSSAIFGSLHQVGGMTSAFLFGICMCILYLQTDNILVPMSIHFLNNFIFVILNQFDTNFLLELPLLIPFTAVCGICSILLLIYIIKESSIVKKEYS
ncbi:MAG: CPBP family intramembrane metalloprotease [Methanobrevibacter sp.]|nr:CPBP family intramembrane metalloprotease [Methanobrevibacter sp.]